MSKGAKLKRSHEWPTHWRRASFSVKDQKALCPVLIEELPDREKAIREQIEERFAEDSARVQQAFLKTRGYGGLSTDGSTTFNGWLIKRRAKDALCFRDIRKNAQYSGTSDAEKVTCPWCLVRLFAEIVRRQGDRSLIGDLLVEAAAMVEAEELIVGT